MTKFQQEYRKESTRLKRVGLFKSLVVLCNNKYKNHYEHLGKVENGKVILSDLGEASEKCWLEIPFHFKNVELDYFVIMPNHIHGVIIINETRNVETCHGMSLQPSKNEFSKPIKNSLSIIVNQFKGSVKRWANKNCYMNFAWQSRFYDRIIRNEKELYNIRRYISNNPLRWEIETESGENIFDL